MGGSYIIIAMKFIRHTLFFSSLLLATVSLLADVPTSGPEVKPKAFSDGHVSISWQKADESFVLRYEIWRAKVNGAGEPSPGDFTKIGEVVQLAGNGHSYSFTDENAFKTTAGVFAYKIRVVFTDQSYLDSPASKTMVVSSTAKRTWGSIKAMFR